MQERKNLGALAESATERIRDALESLELTTVEQRKAAIRRALRERTVGLDEHELSAFLEQVRAEFPDRSYEADQHRRRLAEELEQTKLMLSHALEENATLRDADSNRSAGARTVAQAVARGAGHELRPGASAEDAESVERIVYALARFAVRQEEVALATLKALPGADLDTSGTTLQKLIVAALGGDPKAIEAFDRRVAWIGSTPGALFAAAQQSWKTGTERVLEHLSPSRAQSIAGQSVLKAPAVVRTLKDWFDEIWADFDRHIDTFYRQAFNNVLNSKMWVNTKMGDRQRDDG